MCSAWATICPSGSNTAAEQSARSLMFGEYAARRRATPISSATPASAWRNTSSSTADSSAIEVHHQVAYLVHHGDLTVGQQRGGVRLLDQRRAIDLVAGCQPRSGDNPGLHGLAGNADLAGSFRCRISLVPVTRG